MKRVVSNGYCALFSLITILAVYDCDWATHHDDAEYIDGLILHHIGELFQFYEVVSLSLNLLVIFFDFLNGCCRFKC